jgi:soluble lytic murein transglycosylase
VSSQRRSDVLVHGLERYSRYHPGRALAQRQQLAQDELSPGQHTRLDRAIAFRGLLERDEAVRDWVDQRIREWRDDKLTAMRLRWAISEQDWPALLRHATALSDASAQEASWRYWRARALAETGDQSGAQSLFAEVAQERDYYGFLSADVLGLPYSYGNGGAPARVDVPALPLWANDAQQRVRELLSVDEPRLALAEWNYTLQRLEPAAQLHLAEAANSESWHRMAIDAANASRSWDRLELRFPIAYEEQFRSRAASMNVPVSELMAIARRESAFFPRARSPVGARGLMQLMPATGKAVARKTGMRLDIADLYSVEHNLDLGSAYYQQLLQRFKGNRAVALAAYNAGPNRVQHWIGKGLPLDAWIETIPYRETRDYVKAVLAYSVVFDHRLGEKAQLLTLAERHSQY